MNLRPRRSRRFAQNVDADPNEGGVHPERTKSAFALDGQIDYELMPTADTPETRSFFTVTIECDWDHEHHLEANFRDGVFVSLDH